MTVNTITDEDIWMAAHMDSLDEACGALQYIAEITDGGLAAICFSGFDWDEAPIRERGLQIRHWLETERHYEKGEA